VKKYNVSTVTGSLFKHELQKSPRPSPVVPRLLRERERDRECCSERERELHCDFSNTKFCFIFIFIKQLSSKAMTNNPMMKSVN
jgi:hypothetical protein